MSNWILRQPEIFPWPVARGINQDTSLMAWFDKKQNTHSPSEMECNSQNISGWVEYGIHHGGQEKFVITNGEYVFFSAKIDFESPLVSVGAL